MNLYAAMGTAAGIEVTEIVTERDRWSYLLGVEIARGLSHDRDGIDFDLLLTGLRDALNGRPLMDPDPSS